MIDREDRAECPNNMIRATDARPARWRQVIEVMRLAHGTDVREQLPTVIQME